MGEIAKARAEMAERPQRMTFNDLIESKKGAFQAVMPKGFTADRLVQMAISARNTTPHLAECDASSILSCCLRAASLGMEPSAVDGLGRAYILPYRNGKTGAYEAQFVLGKNGMLELVQRSGLVASIRTQCVYEGDDFDWYEDEDGLHFHYRPDLSAPHGRENMRLVYLSARLKDGGSVFCAMSRREVEEVEGRSKAKFGPWKTDWEAMAEKTVIRRAFNRGMLPRSVEARDAARAIAEDGATPVIVDGEGFRVFDGVDGEAVEVDAETGEVAE